MRTRVAVKTMGNWYWIVDEVNAAGFLPRLAHARRAKLMLGMINKTDKLDAWGLNRLQRTGILPTVWIPPGELLDHRDLAQRRMVFVRQRTQLKNRSHATRAQYALTVPEVGDLFGITLELGDVTRSASGETCAAYAATTPPIHASGGKIRFGPLRPDVNRSLKWAFVEAATVICRHRRRHPTRHGNQLYERVARRKGHPKAIGAGARHVSDATYRMLRNSPYDCDSPPGHSHPAETAKR